MLSRYPVLIIPRRSSYFEGFKAVQRRVQMRFNRTFEVFISQSDFVVNTHYSGPNQCKFETDRYFVALYETPEQVSDFRNAFVPSVL